MVAVRADAELLAGALPADAERGADLAPAGAVNAQVRDGGADLLVVAHDNGPRFGPSRRELLEATERFAKCVRTLNSA